MKDFRFSNVNALQAYQLMRYGSLLLIGILLSKSGIGRTNIGNYETFLLISGAFTFFWVNGFLKVMMPLSSEKTPTETKVLLFNAFIVLLFFSSLAGLLSFSLSKPFSEILLNGNSVPMPQILAAYIFLNSPSLMIEYIYLIRNEPKKIILYGIITFGLQILAIGIPPFFGLGLNFILPLLAIVSAIRFIWLITILIRYSKARFDKKILTEFLQLGTPLVISTLLGSSAAYIDGFIVTSKFSPDDFAIYQYGARELPLALLLANSLNMAMLPLLARKNFRNSLSEFRSEIYRLHWVLFPVSIILILTSHWFYPLVFNPQFEASATIFNVSLLLIINRLLFPQTILTAQKKNHIQVWASLTEILVNVTLSFWFATIFGLVGVAYATFVAYLVEKIFLTIACRKMLNVSLKEYLPLNLYFLSSTILIVIFVLVEFFIY
jgi:O-antigen/teichoic acid export membrane protein